MCVFFYLKQCACVVVPRRFSYYPRRVLLSPQWEIYCLVSALKIFWNLKFSPVSQSVQTGVLRQGLKTVFPCTLLLPIVYPQIIINIPFLFNAVKLIFPFFSFYLFYMFFLSFNVVMPGYSRCLNQFWNLLKP